MHTVEIRLGLSLIHIYWMNYQKELDGLISRLEEQKEVPRLLLHSCCAPCSSYVPVSYTHLDVYKRQRLDRSPPWAISSAVFRIRSTGRKARFVI